MKNPFLGYYIKRESFQSTRQGQRAFNRSKHLMLNVYTMLYIYLGYYIEMSSFQSTQQGQRAFRRDKRYRFSDSINEDILTAAK